MKKLSLFAALLLGIASLQAAPVSREEARSLGQKFVQTRFELSRQSSDLNLVYAMPSFYVFNVGENGFVILSSDDSYRPIIGYSDEGIFNPDDMAPALQRYLTKIDESRRNRTSVSATPAVTADWNALRSRGCLVSRHGGREDEYIVETKWNQNYPYNAMCPADASGPGGHAYAGCVATAASQLMRYWNFPEQGRGQKCYNHETYGQQCANFGTTTYDWANMPTSISANSPQAQIDAIATLHYHVGVALEMGYGPSGSGAVTSRLTELMPQYFFYTSDMKMVAREDYSHEDFMAYIIASIDMRWPMVQRGGGHAYVLDGYNDNDMVHYNWGWSGSSDGWFDVDDHGYTDGESIVYYYVPEGIYNATPAAPVVTSVIPADNNALSATINWTNPSLTLNNGTLTAIDEIVVMRNEQVIYTEENVTPGAAMTFVDNDVPCYDVYRYSVYAVTGGQRGKTVTSDLIPFGPTCEWKFITTSSIFQGWRGGYISVINASGHEISQVTMNSSTPQSIVVNMPLGPITLSWNAPETAVNNMSFIVRDSDNNTVYTFSGNTNDLPEGVFYAGNNGCGNEPTCGTPSHLKAEQNPEEENTIVLMWEGVDDPGYGYCIYRDDVLYRLIDDGSTEFHDVNVPVGGHCYYVTTLCDGGWNGESSNMACAPSGACHAPLNFDGEMTSSFKCLLSWERPEPSEGLSGYYIYRKMGEDGEYQRIKIAGASATTYQDNGLHEEGDFYYQIVAYYGALDCYSAPGAYKYDQNQYYYHFYYSPTSVKEDATQCAIYPNPTTGTVSVEAKDMRQVVVRNVLGQTIYDMSVEDDVLTLSFDHAGIYFVTVQTANAVTTKKVVVE